MFWPLYSFCTWWAGFGPGNTMLNLYRRHQAPCRFASRRYRNCNCPIWVQGSLRGEYLRRALDLRSWSAATRAGPARRLGAVFERSARRGSRGLQGGAVQEHRRDGRGHRRGRGRLPVLSRHITQKSARRSLQTVVKGCPYFKKAAPPGRSERRVHPRVARLPVSRPTGIEAELDSRGGSCRNS